MHEKTILLPLMPASMLLAREPVPVLWFSFIAAFSMWPLLVKVGAVARAVCFTLAQDQLMIAYAGCMLLFAAVALCIIQSALRQSRPLAFAVRP